jgi:trk system potassium uptake protein TrkH
MFIGACAGSTGGGMKVSRILILFRKVKNEISHMVHPKRVTRVLLEKHVVSKEVVQGVEVFLATYVMVFVVSVVLISLDNFDFTTNFTAVAATLNNIGPGLNAVGPAGNFAEFSDMSKWVLMFDMLAGRLELFPMLVLFSPSTWRKG